MYEFVNTKLIKPTKVEIASFDTIELYTESDKEGKIYKLSKKAQEIIHKNLDIKISTSRDLYKKNTTLWHNLVSTSLADSRLKEGDGQHFELTSNNVRYIVCEEYSTIIDIRYCIQDQMFKDFTDKSETFMLDMSTNRSVNKFFGDSNNGPIKLICYDKSQNINENKYTPVVILEIQIEKSIYNCYSGIIIMSPYTLIPNTAPIISTDSYFSFIQYFDMKDALQIAQDGAEDMYNAYTQCLENPVEVSAREVTSILKKCGYKLKINDDNTINNVSAMYDETSNERIRKFYNTFSFVTGESALDILKLSDLQKIFRYNELTLLDLLSILSKEYITPTGGKITCALLTTFVYSMQSTDKMDKGKMTELKKEIEHQ